MNEEFEGIWASMTPAEQAALKQNPRQLVSMVLIDQWFTQNQIVGSREELQPDGTALGRVPAEFAMLVAGK